MKEDGSNDSVVFKIAKLIWISYVFYPLIVGCKTPISDASIDFSNNNFKWNDVEFEDMIIRRVENRMSLDDYYLYLVVGMDY
ncbi:hypothetical protein U3516DRAFT_754487 [Neocallimastix sp. 'constans']